MSFRKDQLKVDETFDFENQKVKNINSLSLNKISDNEAQNNSIYFGENGELKIKKDSAIIQILDENGNLDTEFLNSIPSISSKEIRIKMLSDYSSNLEIDISESSINYQISGDSDPSLGINLSQFLNNNKLEIFRSGLKLDKLTDVTYVSNTNLKFNQNLTSDEIIFIKWS